MNVFLPGFFNHIQNVPLNTIIEQHGLVNDQNEEDTASFSATLFTLLLVMTTIEAVILVLCTIYSWCQLPTAAAGVSSDFWWIDSELDEQYGIISPNNSTDEHDDDDTTTNNTNSNNNNNRRTTRSNRTRSNSSTTNHIHNNNDDQYEQHRHLLIGGEEYEHLYNNNTNTNVDKTSEYWIERNNRIQQILEERYWKPTMTTKTKSLNNNNNNNNNDEKQQQTIQQQSEQQDEDGQSQVQEEQEHEQEEQEQERIVETDENNDDTTTTSKDVDIDSNDNNDIIDVNNNCNNDIIDIDNDTIDVVDNDNNNDDDIPICCSICLTNYTINDCIAGSSKCCRHVFHKQCIVRWLHLQNTCPCCRQIILKPISTNCKLGSLLSSFYYNTTTTTNNNNTNAEEESTNNTNNDNDNENNNNNTSLSTSPFSFVGGIATRFTDAAAIGAGAFVAASATAAAWPDTDYPLETSDFFFFLF